MYVPSAGSVVPPIDDSKSTVDVPPEEEDAVALVVGVNIACIAQLAETIVYTNGLSVEVFAPVADTYSQAKNLKPEPGFAVKVTAVPLL